MKEIGFNYFSLEATTDPTLAFSLLDCFQEVGSAGLGAIVMLFVLKLLPTVLTFLRAILGVEALVIVLGNT